MNEKRVAKETIQDHILYEIGFYIQQYDQGVWTSTKALKAIVKRLKANGVIKNG